jgi:hypothetical protein
MDIKIEASPGNEQVYAWFDGVLDGRIADVGELRRAVLKWDALGLPKAMFSVEGGRFNFMPGDETAGAQVMSEEGQAEILAILEDMVTLGSESGSVESTLRCTLVKGQDTTEFLFGCVGNELRSVSRSRALSHEDREHIPRQEMLPESVRALGRNRALLILLLAFVAFFGSAWQSGWFSSVLSPGLDELIVEEGAFEGMLILEIKRSWGNYEVTVMRGETYPTTPTATQDLRDDAADNARDVAITTVSSGQQVYIQLLNEEDKVLEVVSLGLRDLITEEGAEVTGKLRGRISADSIRLALSSGMKDE